MTVRTAPLTSGWVFSSQDALERPVVENVDHPDQHDQPPAGVHVTDVRRVHAHPAARVLEDPPRGVENRQRQHQRDDRRDRLRPALDQFALLQITCAETLHYGLLSQSGWVKGSFVPAFHKSHAAILRCGRLEDRSLLFPPRSPAAKGSVRSPADRTPVLDRHALRNGLRLRRPGRLRPGPLARAGP